MWMWHLRAWFDDEHLVVEGRKFELMNLEVISNLNHSFYGSTSCFKLTHPKRMWTRISHSLTNILVMGIKKHSGKELSPGYCMTMNTFSQIGPHSVIPAKKELAGFSKSGDQATDILAI